jgi:hypothetical protein
LQTPTELDSEESETHVPDLPEVQARLLHVRNGCSMKTKEDTTEIHGFPADESREFAWGDVIKTRGVCSQAKRQKDSRSTKPSAFQGS